MTNQPNTTAPTKATISTLQIKLAGARKFVLGLCFITLATGAFTACKSKEVKNDTEVVTPETTTTPEATDADKIAWNKANGSGTIASYRGYLSDFPNGSYTNEANQRIRDLEAGNKPTTEATPAPKADANAEKTERRTKLSAQVAREAARIMDAVVPSSGKNLKYTPQGTGNYDIHTKLWTVPYEISFTGKKCTGIDNKEHLHSVAFTAHYNENNEYYTKHVKPNSVMNESMICGGFVNAFATLFKESK